MKVQNTRIPLSLYVRGGPCLLITRITRHRSCRQEQVQYYDRNGDDPGRKETLNITGHIRSPEDLDIILITLFLGSNRVKNQVTSLLIKPGI